MGFAVKNGIQGLSSKADLKNFPADITTALRSELAALTAYQLLLPTPHSRGSNSSTCPYDQLCHDFGPLDCRVRYRIMSELQMFLSYRWRSRFFTGLPGSCQDSTYQSLSFSSNTTLPSFFFSFSTPFLAVS